MFRCARRQSYAFPPQKLPLLNEIVGFPERKTSSNARARFWFQSVEMMTGTILMNGS
jgi:hypothetical protein